MLKFPMIVTLLALKYLIVGMDGLDAMYNKLKLH